MGKLQIESPFVQAALSGYSDLPMRRLARRFGAAYTLNEVVLDKFVLQKTRKPKLYLQLTEDDHPVGGQLMGSNPQDFAPAAAAMAEAGYDAIDINFGCPVKKVLGRCRGGYLLSQPKIALEMIASVCDAVGTTHPVTVKMRRGTDDSPQAECRFFTILDGAFEAGVSAITVHGRTVDQRYVGPSDWSFLAKVKKHVGDRVILGSGDLFSAEACLQMMKETGVDGVTIARGCIGNPWIFQECLALMRGERLPPPPTIMQQYDAITGHWNDMVSVYGDALAGRLMRKFGIKYAEHHPIARGVRDAFIAAQSPRHITELIDRWYDPSGDYPPVKRRKGHGDLIAAGATK
jgi:nifR3 family TIM-barrel protein